MEEINQPAFAKASARRRKILIATGIYPPDIGGPASIIAPLAESLRQRGFVIKIITY